MFRTLYIFIILVIQKIFISAPSTLTTSKLTTGISEVGNNPASRKTATTKDSPVTEISDDDSKENSEEGEDNEEDGDDDDEKEEETNDEEDENGLTTTSETGTILNENGNNPSSKSEGNSTRNRKFAIFISTLFVIIRQNIQ